MSDKEKISTAWHEAGHAIVNVLLEHTHPLHKGDDNSAGKLPGCDYVLPEGINARLNAKRLSICSR